MPHTELTSADILDPYGVDEILARVAELVAELEKDLKQVDAGLG